MSTHNALFHHHISFLSVHEQQQDACDEKEDAVHDAERKARLQHRACLIDIDSERRVGGLPKISKGAQT